MKSLGCGIAVLFLFSFGVLAQTAQPPATEAKPAEEAKPADAKPAEAVPEPAGPQKIDPGKPIAMLDYAQWEDPTRVAGNIVAECANLGKQFADATEKAGHANGFTFNKGPAADPRKAEQALVLKMVSAVSAGNAFTGHRKTVTARAEVYVNGKMVKNTSVTRDSMGGAFAGFKGSCSVLERTVTTLGADVAKWLKAVAR